MKRLFYLLAAAAFTACGSATTLSVMTFNMRYDNPEDGADNWRFRRGRVAEVIASHGVDVFGTQELPFSEPVESRKQQRLFRAVHKEFGGFG